MCGTQARTSREQKIKRVKRHLTTLSESFKGLGLRKGGVSWYSARHHFQKVHMAVSRIYIMRQIALWRVLEILGIRGCAVTTAKLEYCICSIPREGTDHFQSGRPFFPASLARRVLV